MVTGVALATGGHLGWHSATPQRRAPMWLLTHCADEVLTPLKGEDWFLYRFPSPRALWESTDHVPGVLGQLISVSDLALTPFSRNHTPIEPYVLSPPSKLAAWTAYWLKRADFSTAITVCPERTLPPHCPIRKTLNARKCLLNKHLITLNKTVRESYCRFTTQERKALQGTAKSLLLLI